MHHVQPSLRHPASVTSKVIANASPGPANGRNAAQTVALSMARDSAVQIFDAYLVETMVDRPALQHDSKFITSVAAVALSWGMRLHHDGPGTLDLTGFKELDTLDLVTFEKSMLETLLADNTSTYSMQPQLVPASFVCELLHLIEGTAMHHVDMHAVTDSLITEFWEHHESMLFAPSTIAIAAIIMAFSVLQLDCTAWLQVVPDVVLHPLAGLHGPTTPAVPDANAQAFDVDLCLQCFSRVVMARGRGNPSPTTVMHSISPRRGDQKLPREGHLPPPAADGSTLKPEP